MKAAAGGGIFKRTLSSGSAAKNAHWIFTKKSDIRRQVNAFASYLYLSRPNALGAMQKRAALITSKLILDSLSLGAIQPFSIKSEPTRAPPVGHVTRLFVLWRREGPLVQRDHVVPSRQHKTLFGGGVRIVRRRRARAPLIITIVCASRGPIIEALVRMSVDFYEWPPGRLYCWQNVFTVC